MTAFVARKPGKTYKLMSVNISGEDAGEYSNLRKGNSIYSVMQDTSIVKRFRKNAF